MAAATAAKLSGFTRPSHRVKEVLSGSLHGNARFGTGTGGALRTQSPQFVVIAGVATRRSRAGCLRIGTNAHRCRAFVRGLNRISRYQPRIVDPAAKLSRALRRRTRPVIPRADHRGPFRLYLDQAERVTWSRATRAIRWREKGRRVDGSPQQGPAGSVARQTVGRTTGVGA